MFLLKEYVELRKIFLMLADIWVDDTEFYNIYMEKLAEIDKRIVEKRPLVVRKLKGGFQRKTGKVTVVWK